MNSVATTFATQPVCNAAQAAQALRSNQLCHSIMYFDILLHDIVNRICLTSCVVCIEGPHYVTRQCKYISTLTVIFYHETVLVSVLGVSRS